MNTKGGKTRDRIEDYLDEWIDTHKFSKKKSSEESDKMVVNLESHEGASNKFYNLEITKTHTGYLLDQSWGAIGKKTMRLKDWPRSEDYYESFDTAKSALDKILETKLKKGYQVVKETSDIHNAAAPTKDPKSPKASPQPKEMKPRKEKPINCPSFKSLEDCGKNEICSWSSKTNKCAKNRVSKKTTKGIYTTQ